MLLWKGALVCNRGMHVCWCLWFGYCRAVGGSSVRDTIADPWDKNARLQQTSQPAEAVDAHPRFRPCAAFRQWQQKRRTGKPPVILTYFGVFMLIPRWFPKLLAMCSYHLNSLNNNFLSSSLTSGSRFQLIAYSSFLFSRISCISVDIRFDLDVTSSYGGFAPILYFVYTSVVLFTQWEILSPSVIPDISNSELQLGGWCWCSWKITV